MSSTNMKTALFVITIFLVFTGCAAAGGPETKPRKGTRDYPPMMAGARAVIYKTVGKVDLPIHIFCPEGHRASDRRPAVVFFFGGGWMNGSPGQFEQQCRYFSARGMVAITADYRVALRHGVKAAQCVADAKSAIRYVRAHAGELGVDPKRIAAGGGSAGGHIAACAGTIPGQEEPGEDLSVSAVPDALVLFNPVLVLAPWEGRKFGGFGAGFGAARLGADPMAISPVHHVKAGVPPAIVFHGKADATVPFATAEAFSEAMRKAGNRCELTGFEGKGHGFFNFSKGDNSMFCATMKKADRFLVSLGWLAGDNIGDKIFGASQ